jgi:hypothetical protein
MSLVMAVSRTSNGEEETKRNRGDEEIKRESEREGYGNGMGHKARKGSVPPRKVHKNGADKHTLQTEI